MYSHLSIVEGTKLNLIFNLQPVDCRDCPTVSQFHSYQVSKYARYISLSGQTFQPGHPTKLSPQFENGRTVGKNHALKVSTAGH